MLVQALNNTRDGVWWGPVQLVLPLLVIVLLSLPQARAWFALPRGRRARRARVSPGRMFQLRHLERGQTAPEYVGLVLVVVAIVGGLVAVGVGTEITSKISTQICKLTGGGDCGDSGGGADKPVADGSKTGDDPDEGPVQAKSPEEKEYEAAKKAVEDLEKALEADKEKAKEAAKALMKILADELGITAGLDCLLEGDASACGETILNILTSLVGGAVGKLAAKYGAPWKWKQAAELVKKIKKHGGDVATGLKGIIDKSSKLKKARQRLKKAEGACNHSFLPGTPVLLADGRRPAIEDVRVGDLVTVTDPKRGLTTTRPVAGTITTEDDKDFTRLTVRVGGRTTVITSTDTHPFWLNDQKRWVEASDIRAGAELRTPQGNSLPVVKVSQYEKLQRTHDLSIEDIQTYYVELGGSAALVHNCPAKNPNDPKNWKKPSWNKDLKNPKVGDKDGGNGAWGSRDRNPPSTPKNEAWLRYQEQISGVKRGKEYIVKSPDGGRPVEFDGWDSKRGTFLEAKNGYGGQVSKAGKLNKSTADTFAKEARRQIRAADGKPVEWHFSNPEATKAAKKFFRDEGINVKVIHTPVKK
ncbi:Tox-REase-5 domain-containing protein [Streptomyces gobiensis]|uniref:Tox-REase-5 domain-containing protein n=1 Tax=Streptomyces gobiensis TaxID=2875706 RepID=UPI001E379C37|nr:Tox-REase-5 domain-containing protein [Streptomyces gobiensis]UGY93371.1 Tox-REase-5 domain-containing protein [Streptomyces gobiensis]